ncbi:hypothetical protein HGRIS_013727 [Hohenbuehelia grisea]|uniref:F-box domain-containing protein n=1 Tax=Hohenbuehelia grisea TaxID=104357 RepID=A0ABR3IWI4_9AGAR
MASSSRKSARLSANVASGSRARFQTDDDSADEELKRPTVKRKKTRKQAKSKVSKRPGRGGKLRKLPEMPLDILYEIFSHLDPLDVLRLARATKALRDMLMRRSAKTVWRAACANIDGLPECPSDLSDPQWVNLAFDACCHYCGQGRATYVIWVYMKRFCKKCLNIFIAPCDHLWGDFRLGIDYQTQTNVFQILPIPAFRLPDAGYVQNSCLTPFVKELWAAYHECQPDEVEAFLDARSVIKKERTKFAERCIYWERRYQEMRAAMQEDLRESRRTAILERATQAGYGREAGLVDYLDDEDFDDHPMVRQARKLTDRIWANISPHILEIFERVRQRFLVEQKEAEIERRKALFVEVAEAILKKLPPNEIVPSPADLYYLKEDRMARNLIESPPFDVEMSLEALDGFKDVIPALIEKWKRHCTQLVVDILNSTRSSNEQLQNAPVNDVTVLNLASSTVRCRTCAQYLSYPRILAHSCPRKSYVHFIRALHHLNTSPLFGEPWTSGWDVISYDQEVLNTMITTIKAYGFDPQTATIHDLDNADRMLACRQCSMTTTYFAVGWQAAARHSKHDGSWIVISAEDTAEAKRVFAITCFSKACVHCDYETFTSEPLMRTHFQLKHDHIDTPVEGVDFVQKLDHPLFRNCEVRIHRQKPPVEPVGSNRASWPKQTARAAPRGRRKR